MKEQILKVVKTALTKDYLLDAEFSLTVNYKPTLKGYYDNPLLLKDINISEVDKNLSEIGEIDGYNLTLLKTRGMEDTENFAKNWRSVDYVFWAGKNDDDNFELDTLNYGKFEWTTTGEREQISGNGIAEKLAKYVREECDDVGETIYSNFFDYESVGEVMDSLNELDLLLDKQHEEKLKIYNKIRLELSK